MRLVSVAVATFFSRLGVDLASPNAIALGKSVFWSDRTGILLIRATKQDLDLIERGLADFEVKRTNATNAIESPTSIVTGVNQAMGLTKSRLEALTDRVPVLGDIPLLGKLFRSDTNASPARTPQILLRARFVEIKQDDVGAFGFDWYLGNFLLANEEATNSVEKGSSQFHGVLTEPQLRVVLRALEQRPGVDLLTFPGVTTATGRAEVQAVDLRTVVTGINPEARVSPGIISTKSVTNSLLETTVMSFGSVLDVSELAVDNRSVNRTVTPTVSEFLGYDDPKTNATVYVNGKRKKITAPLPHFRIRQTTVTANVLDGQTLVLGNPRVTEVFKQLDGTMKTNAVSDTKLKHLLIFITPMLVDDTGSRLHSDDERGPVPK